MQVALRRVPDLIKTTLLSTECKIKKMAKNMLGYNSILFVGRANDYATALEAALKVKEIAYVHSEGVMASELKHGPLALIDDRVCLVVFATRNAYYQKMVSVIEQLKARKAHIYVVCDEYDTNMRNLLEDDDRIIEVPVNHEFTQHIINIIPMQLLAFHLATMKGNKVDQPRNLAKSVTVSD
jgi:glucosamine--fructose-6-phosphate aminotransferase (isomerizing)